ncbi:hypothetical protein EXIGLDRAFT_625586 [Exidia glandulosa HHB12029]|uniref:Solute carrier family 40 member n=1 Tax=Exidia glandulosa HHB12029 TaxID=1314781 RepID=A0A165CZ72_EXIGL|nr:hypothetical protein EXIGLDRAFT_625586 [Exidia glandulosa HHB12029]
MAAVELAVLDEQGTEGPATGSIDDGTRRADVQAEPERWSPSRKAVAVLALQHFSFAWNQRTVEFALVICLVILFPDSLVPSSLVALTSALAVILLSGWIGSFVDKTNRLTMVRVFLFSAYGSDASQALGHRTTLDSKSAAIVRLLLAAAVIFAAATEVIAVGHNVAFMRDWVVAIAGDDMNLLTRLNTILRRVDLVCKLVAPLFVSALTSTLSPALAVGILLAVAGVSFLFEIGWIGFTYRAFPPLAQMSRPRSPSPRADNGTASDPVSSSTRLRRIRERSLRGLRTAFEDWKTFVKMPVFLSSLAISFLYFTTLSFDGSLINYMLNVRHWQDSFIAGMRGIGVVSGLLGTALMPWLERKLGLVRAGHWSIWFQVLCLLPAVLSFYIGIRHSNQGESFPVWNSVMLLAGVLLSRIGLWSFDLVQLKELQTELDPHPRRNALTGLQYSLQSVFGAATSILTIIVSNPQNFGVTAVVSFSAVVSGAVCYAAYVKRSRHHLFHFYWPIGRKSS